MNDFDSFSVCFNIMKIKYAKYDTTLDDLNFLTPTDSVNVFINVESVMRSISAIKDVDRKVFNQKDLSEIMISNFINLAAHYRRFFRGNGLDTKIFLFMTDIHSDNFNEYRYNTDFRCYYILKYTKNPKYSYIGQKLHEEIIPQVQEITSFIPGVYFINANNIDGSLVPMIISRTDTRRKNLIITGEYADTQYTQIPNFVCHYLRRSPTGYSTSYTLDMHLKSLVKKPEDKDYDTECNVYSNPAFYTLLFSVMGDQYRSVERIPNIGNATLLKYILDGMRNSKVTMNTSNIQTLESIFPADVKEDVRKNFCCISISEMVSKITKEQEYSITSQMVDRFNHNGLLQLNSGRFYNHRFMLEELTM